MFQQDKAPRTQVVEIYAHETLMGKGILIEPNGETSQRGRLIFEPGVDRSNIYAINYLKSDSFEFSVQFISMTSELSANFEIGASQEID